MRQEDDDEEEKDQRRQQQQQQAQRCRTDIYNTHLHTLTRTTHSLCLLLLSYGTTQLTHYNALSLCLLLLLLLPYGTTQLTHYNAREHQKTKSPMGGFLFLLYPLTRGIVIFHILTK
jgi:hypothetical protein